jgi:hypothetical protein
MLNRAKMMLTHISLMKNDPLTSWTSETLPSVAIDMSNSNKVAPIGSSLMSLVCTPNLQPFKHAQLVQDETGEQREHKSNTLDNRCGVVASGSVGKKDPSKREQ